MKILQNFIKFLEARQAELLIKMAEEQAKKEKQKDEEKNGR